MKFKFVLILLFTFPLFNLQGKEPIAHHEFGLSLGGAYIARHQQISPSVGAYYDLRSEGSNFSFGFATQLHFGEKSYYQFSLPLVLRPWRKLRLWASAGIAITNIDLFSYETINDTLDVPLFHLPGDNPEYSWRPEFLLRFGGGWQFETNRDPNVIITPYLDIYVIRQEYFAFGLGVMIGVDMLQFRKNQPENK